MRFLAIAIASVILFFPTFWLFNLVVGANWGAGIAAVAMYLAFPILGGMIWRAPASQRSASMEDALAAGELGTVEYGISDVVEVDACADEGKYFLLAIGPSETLVLFGQYLDEAIERGAFPSTRIRLFWHKSLGVTYGVQCLGDPIKSKVRRFGFMQEHRDTGVVLKDRALVPRSIRDVVSRDA